MTNEAGEAAVVAEEDKEHEELTRQLIEDVFSDEHARDGIPFEKVTLLIWHCRNEPRVVTLMARFLTKYAGRRDVFDGIEFYLPQLAHMIIHLEANWDDAVLERFALTISQHSLHFALQLNWILQGAIEDYQPETRDGEPNPSFNALFYTRCVKLLAKLERSVVYGRPIAQELHRLYERGKISRKEYETLELADRRFNAAQIVEEDTHHRSHNGENGEPNSPKSYSADTNPYGGWLLYKRRSRKNWHKRKQWKRRYFAVSDQMFYCHAETPNDSSDWSQLVRAMPLEGAEVKITLNGKYPHMFEVHNQYYLFKLRASSERELDRWMTLLRDEAEHSSLFSKVPMSLGQDSSHFAPEEREKKNKLVSDLNPYEHARYMFFKEERAFVRDMCDVAEKLRFQERDERKKLAPGFMDSVRVPTCAYVPMCNNTDPWRRMERFFSKETKVFNTKERCPVIMFYITEKGKPTDVDVADYLHREYDPTERDSSEIPVVDDGDVFHSAQQSTSVSSVWTVRTLDDEEDEMMGHGNGAEHMQEGGNKRNMMKNQRFQSMFIRERDWLQIPSQLLSNIGEMSPSRKKSIFNRKSVTHHKDGVDHRVFPVRSVRILESKDADEVEAEDAHNGINGGGDNGFHPKKPESFKDPISPDCLERAKKIVCGGEVWAEKKARLLTEAHDLGVPNADVGVVMAKSNDDVRQEVFVMQMIHYYHSIFASEGLPIWLKTYRILSTSKDTGLIEFLKDATSIDGLKKSDGYPEKGGMLAYFKHAYGDLDSPSFLAAQRNFTVSLVGYSLVAYLLGLKDRHNGNVMIDIRGHIIHIDFGFAMGMAPGHEFSIERAPFKLTTDYMDVMGGEKSKCFAEFKRLFVAGFEAARANSQVALGLVEIMMYQSNYPCFSGPRYGNGVALQAFKERLMVNVPDQKIKKKALQLIDTAIEHTGTKLYDKFQLQSNGILP